jgi:serine protease
MPARKPKQPRVRFDVTEKPRVIVQFRSEYRVPYEDGAEKAIEAQNVGPWRSLAAEFPGITLKRLLRTTTTDQLDRLIERARNTDPDYRPGHFFGYFYVESSQSTNLAALAKAFRSWPSVQAAYVDIPGPDPVVNAADDPRFPNQGYLDPAPDGIDAEYAWGFTGGDGAGQRVIDLERGWTLNHEDLNAQGAALLHGVLLDTSRAHGTAVLGEICAVDNAVGCVGIVPNIGDVNVVSFNGSTRVDAIIAAIGNMVFGDTLLLEAQVTVDGASLLGPIEAYDAEFDAIRLATALGIIVVEAGGNGTNNGFAPPLAMDTFTDPMGRQVFNPGSADFRDSGAIIVTAATSTAPHTRLVWAPHGQRIDCYAWGENINSLSSTTAGSTTSYQTGFGGTSGASPIITGAVLALQGMAQSTLGYRFSPRQMREIIRDPANGTAAAATEITTIRQMPDLRAIIDGNILGLTPDLYLRDFVGDTGEPHAGPVSASPDVILRPTAVANPQASFGAGSGTENDATLGFTAEAGQDNVIYVRVLNQGGAAAVNATATVYWSPVATLVTPDLWTLVGSAVLPNVPTGEVLTVAPGIPWLLANIPAPGHYCLIGLIDHPDDPAPSPGDLLNWTNFTDFIRNNNNVTWRNFNVEDNDPSPDPTVPRDFQALPFLAPGAFDRARPMQLELIARLPAEAKLFWEMPAGFFDMLPGRFANAQIDKRRRVVRVAIRPIGRFRLPAAMLPAKSRTRMRLVVHIPPQLRKNRYEVAVRQLWERQELGRVTWHLAPDVRKRQKAGGRPRGRPRRK